MAGDKRHRGAAVATISFLTTVTECVATLALMGATQNETPGFDREVRLGVVLYGGVSLAVYIGGVVRELFDAVHGRGVYKLLRALIGSDLKVDIISGTSAGGINGVLLAFALANNLELDGLAQLWREQGDLEKLMRSIGEAKPPSLLDGEGYFQKRLEEALKAMLEKPNRESKGDPVDAIDLFVTATDFHGQLGFVLDDLADVIEVKDHRRVFQLKFRSGRDISDLRPPAGKPDDPEWRKALATVCRATATFPGAFEPVLVPADERAASSTRTAWHHYLHDWSASKSPHDFVLVDGGVIDNKPFTHTLNAIYARTTEREVDRKLVFCEPDPENFEPVVNKVPDFGEVVVAALSTLPGYETIADDLQNLADHNARVASYQELVRNLAKLDLPKQSPKFRTEFYLRARTIGYSEELLSEVIGARQGYARARRDADGRPLDAERTTLEALAREVRDTTKTAVTEQFLHDFDVGFRKRRLFHTVYALYDELYTREPRPSPERAAQIRALLPKLNAQLHLLKIVGWTDSEWRELFGKAFLDGPDVWKRYYERLSFLFSEVPKELLDSPSELHKLLVSRLKQNADRGSTPPAGKPGLLDQIDQHVSCGEPSYQQFELLDELTYPIETLARLDQKDPIDTLRISPQDAQLGFCKRAAYDKVTGEALGHFGAFMKRSWRSNDIMWGRLDSTTLLIQELLSAHAVGRAHTSKTELLKLVDELYGKSPLTDEVQTLKAWVERLGADRKAASEVLLDKKSKVHEALAKLAQADIIEKELRNVLYDAVVQGAEWGTVPPAQDGLDAHVAAWSATQIRQLAVAFERDEQPQLTPVPIRFADYKVGEESLTKDVPPVVLLRLATHAALVMQNVLAPVADRAMPLGMAKAMSPVFAAVRWATFFVYAFAATSKARTVMNAAMLASGVILVASVPMSDFIWPPGEAVKWGWALAFWVVPAAWLTLYLLIIQRSWVRWVAALIGGFGLGLGVAFVEYGKYGWLTEAVRAAGAQLSVKVFVEGLLPLVLVLIGFAVVAEPWRWKVWQRRKNARS